MFQTVFTTHNVPRSDRLALFDRAQTASDHPMRAFSNHADRFSARIDAVDLAAVNVAQLTVSPADVIRTGRQVRDFDPDLYCIVIPRRGRVLLEQGGNQAALQHGSFALYSSSQPFRVQIAGPDGPRARWPRAGDLASLLRVQVPKSLFQLPSSELDRLLAQPLAGTTGVGGLLTGFLGRLSSDGDRYTRMDLARLGNLTVDLMTATLAHQIDAQAPRAVAESTLFMRLTAFIDQHLGDPGLSPPDIAAAHHISVGYLHRLFRAQGTTVGTLVRTRRLDKARRDLDDPGLGEVPIHRIAARWGFADHATFTRAFRAGFGVTPTEYRSTGHIAVSASGVADPGRVPSLPPPLTPVTVAAAEHTVPDVDSDDAGAGAGAA